LGVLGFLLMGSDLQGNARAPGNRYAQLIRRADTRWVYTAIGFVGLLFGVVPSYMAAYLIDNGVNVAAFFSTFAIVMFGARFFVAPFIEKTPHSIVVGAGILAMGVAYMAIGYLPLTRIVLPAGILFGLGYSQCYPRLSVMAITPFADNNREKPIALFNVFFVAGTCLTPYFIGAFKYATSISVFLLALGTSAVIFGMGFFAKVAFAPAPSQNPPS
jgi:MFS family permease